MSTEKLLEDLTVRKAEIVLLLNSLNQTNESFDSQLFYECFYKLHKFTSENPSNLDLKLFSVHNCERLFAKMLKYYSEIANELDYRTDKSNLDELIKLATLNERRLTIFSHLLLILNQLLFKMVSFNLEFIKNDGLSGLFALIRNEKFFQSLSEHDLKVLSCLVNSLNLLSKYFDYSDQIKSIWVESKISTVFINIAQNCRIFKIVRFVYLILANISDEDTIQSLPEINQVIKSLVSDMNSFCNYFKTTQTINRISIEIIDSKKIIREHEISFLNGKSLIGVLYGLNKLAADPALKHRIWEANYAQTSLKYIILNGNEIEKLFALRLLHNLCLVESVVQFVLLDTALKNSIESLTKNNKVKIAEIRSVSQKIVDLIKKQDIPIKDVLIGAAMLVGYFVEKFYYQIEKGY